MQNSKGSVITIHYTLYVTAASRKPSVGGARLKLQSFQQPGPEPD